MYEDQIAALEREKAGYEARKLDDRVSSINAEIDRLKAAENEEPFEANAFPVSDDRATDLQAPSTEARREAAKHGRTIPNIHDRAVGDVRVDDPPSPDVIKTAPLGDEVLADAESGGDFSSTEAERLANGAENEVVPSAPNVEKPEVTDPAVETPETKPAKKAAAKS